jgi:hypothetical protein
VSAELLMTALTVDAVERGIDERRPQPPARGLD